MTSTSDPGTRRDQRARERIHDPSRTPHQFHENKAGCFVRVDGPRET